MNVNLIFSVFLSAIVLLACSSNEDCFSTDTIEQIKSVKMNNQEYFLFLRVSGFQEKASFYELYKGMPNFNECGRTENPPVSIAHEDSSEGRISRLVIDGEELKIIYDETGKETKPRRKTVPVVVK